MPKHRSLLTIHNLAFKQWPTRIVGCTGYPADSHDTIYLHLNNQLKHHRCPECGSGKYSLHSRYSHTLCDDWLLLIIVPSFVAQKQCMRWTSRVTSTPATTKSVFAHTITFANTCDIVAST